MILFHFIISLLSPSSLSLTLHPIPSSSAILPNMQGMDHSPPNSIIVGHPPSDLLERSTDEGPHFSTKKIVQEKGNNHPFSSFTSRQSQGSRRSDHYPSHGKSPMTTSEPPTVREGFFSGEKADQAEVKLSCSFSIKYSILSPPFVVLLVLTVLSIFRLLISSEKLQEGSFPTNFNSYRHL